mmetsp:Transcript_7557/g.18743  ORF Transcript_7557/g.18743 Transcript_7557/m.18743 type:complete len:259 (+) Transcript_7557:459-1235(+)
MTPRFNEQYVHCLFGWRHFSDKLKSITPVAALGSSRKEGLYSGGNEWCCVGLLNFGRPIRANGRLRSALVQCLLQSSTKLHKICLVFLLPFLGLGHRLAFLLPPLFELGLLQRLPPFPLPLPPHAPERPLQRPLALLDEVHLDPRPEQCADEVRARGIVHVILAEVLGALPELAGAARSALLLGVSAAVRHVLGGDVPPGGCEEGFLQIPRDVQDDGDGHGLVGVMRRVMFGKTECAGGRILALVDKCRSPLPHDGVL